MAQLSRKQDVLRAAPEIPNLVHLHAFARTARTGSITETGRQLNISQPAITQGIAKLELHLGAKLFDRRYNGMVATPVGEVYLYRAQRGIDLLQRAVAYIARSSSRIPTKPHRLFSVGQLKSLIAAIDAESFRLAAQTLRLQPSTVQRACRHLERQIGCALFDVTSTGMRATRQGKELGRLCKLALVEIRQAYYDVSGWKGRFEGRIAVGCLPLAQTSLLPKAINLLSAEYPLLSIAVVDGRYEDLLKALRDGELDCIIGALRVDRSASGVVQQELFVDRMVIVGRKGHPLEAETDITRERLAEFPWVAPRSGSPARAFFESFRSRLKLERGSARSVETSALPVVRGVLLGSDRLTIMSALQVRYEIDQGLLVAIPYPLRGSTRSIGITLREDWSPTTPQQRLLEHLHSIAKSE